MNLWSSIPPPIKALLIGSALVCCYTDDRFHKGTSEASFYPIFHNIKNNNNKKKTQSFAEREIYPLASEIHLGMGILLNFRKNMSTMIREQGTVFI